MLCPRGYFQVQVLSIHNWNLYLGTQEGLGQLDFSVYIKVMADYAKDGIIKYLGLDVEVSRWSTKGPGLPLASESEFFPGRHPLGDLDIDLFLLTILLQGYGLGCASEYLLEGQRKLIYKV